MVSKDLSNKVPSRIPETKIVGPSRFRKPLADLVSEDGRAFVSPYVVGSGNADGDGNGTTKPEPKDLGDELVADVPSLTDIESVVKTKYFDPVTKVEKAKIIIKIRNSSKNKSNIAGVDARIPPKEG
jgi:hypothetical protein